MLILENRCPQCFGNLVFSENGSRTLVCEDCGATDKPFTQKEFNTLLLEAEEWGPKERRLVPSEIGKLLLEPYGGLMDYLRETLKEGMRGLGLDDSEMSLLRRYKLIKED